MSLKLWNIVTRTYECTRQRRAAFRREPKLVCRIIDQYGQEVFYGSEKDGQDFMSKVKSGISRCETFFV